MIEEFRDIAGYEGLYQVSNLGRVKSLKFWCGRYGDYYDREKILKLTNNKNGYLQVDLCKNKKHKRWYVHRLVAMTFIDNPNNYPCINHKDENKQNNVINNLEFCSRIYNNNYGNRIEKFAKKCRKPVVCLETGKEYNSVSECAKEMGVTISCISQVLKEKRKTANKYHFEYKD